jgi:histidinol-phosphatase (PHP family)
MSQPAPLLYESHAHTPLCKHATGAPEDYALRAEARGLRGIVFTCHCPLPDGHSRQWRMDPEQFEDYVALIAGARERLHGRVDVRLGLESDYFPGIEPWLERLHGRTSLHHVLGSVHTQSAPYRAAYYRGDAWDYQKTYFQHLAQAAESGLFDTLSHPDLVKNEAPHEWDFARIRPDVERALDRIARTGVAMELNTSGLNKALPEMNPGRDMLRLMAERGIPVVLGADAHRPDRVADRFEEALWTLETAGFRDISFFLDRQRQIVPIAAARASLRPVAPAQPVSSR